MDLRQSFIKSTRQKEDDYVRAKEYIRDEVNGNYAKAYLVKEGWEIEIYFQGKKLNYGASNCSRAFWNSRKLAVEAVDSIFYKGIERVFAEEHKRQFGY